MNTKPSLTGTTCPKLMPGLLRTDCAARLLQLLLLLTLPAVVQAQFDYTTDNGNITITGYTGPGGVVTIPSTINGLTVTRIGEEAFLYQSSLTSVTIGNSVTSIGGRAFEGCTSLATVTIPNSVTTIGAQTFYGCTSLTNITIPASVTFIGGSAFYYCTSLTAITVDVLNSAYSSVDGVLFDKSQTTLIQYPGGNAASYTIPNSVTYVEGSAFSGSGLTSVTIGDGVTNIGSYAFSECYSLTGITIPNNVTRIGYGAFQYCDGLTSATIGNSVTNIGSTAFQYCSSLAAITVDAFNSSYSSVDGVLFNKSQTTIIQYPGGKAGNYTMPNSVTSIGYYAFIGGTSVTSVTVGNSVTSIGDSTFQDCTSLTNVTIPNSVTSIGEGAFNYCTSLSSVMIGNGVTNVGVYAFNNCTSLRAITVDTANPVYSTLDGVLFNKNQTVLLHFPQGKAGSYTIPNSVSSIRDWMFAYCRSLSSVTIGNSVTSIGDYGFYGCTSLTSVSIGNSVTNIGAGAFSGCTGLTSVTIPNSVTSIREYAFYYCGTLTGVYFKGNAPSLGSSVFDGDENATVYYLPGSTGWGSTFAGRPTAPWNPQVRTNDASFGVRTNQFGFNITWASGMIVVVEACTNLANPIWFPVETNTLTGGSSYFSDPQWTNHPTRFYRLRSP